MTKYDKGYNTTKKFLIVKTEKSKKMLFKYKCKSNKNGFYDRIVVFIFNFLFKNHNGSLLTPSRLLRFVSGSMNVLKSNSKRLETSERFIVK